MRTLLIEDEPELAAALSAVLISNGIVVDHIGSLSGAEEAVKSFAYDVLILDRRLPDGEGLSLIPKLRAHGNLTPVLVLTARGEVSDRVEGLDHGADDYLAKPFAVEEVLARVRALARRPAAVLKNIVQSGNLTYDYTAREALVNEEVLDLTRREHLVLGALLRQIGRMVSRSTLMDAVFSMDDDVLPNALDTHVSRLRRKLADAGSGLQLNGVRGVGFMLREL